MFDLYQYKSCELEEYGVYADVHIEQRISSLIENLYCSKSLNKEAIAESLTWICHEICPQYEEQFSGKDILLSYQDDFPKTFSNWLDCIDDATGELNYHKLLMGCAQVKEIAEFDGVFNATDALVNQLTTFKPFNESVLAGALICLAKRYGVKHEEVLYTNSHVIRG